MKTYISNEAFEKKTKLKKEKDKRTKLVNEQICSDYTNERNKIF